MPEVQEVSRLFSGSHATDVTAVEGLPTQRVFSTCRLINNFVMLVVQCEINQDVNEFETKIYLFISLFPTPGRPRRFSRQMFLLAAVGLSDTILFASDLHYASK